MRQSDTFCHRRARGRRFWPRICLPRVVSRQFNVAPAAERREGDTSRHGISQGRHLSEWPCLPRRVSWQPGMPEPRERPRVTLFAVRRCEGDVSRADSVSLAWSRGARPSSLPRDTPRETLPATAVPKGDFCGTGPFTLAHSRDTHPYGLPQNAARVTLPQRNSVSLAGFHGSPRGSCHELGQG